MSLNLEKYICFPKISRTAFFQNTYQCIWMLVWFCKKHEKPPLKVFCKKRCLRACSHERRNELIPVWDFKPAWKQVLFTWSFISAAFQNDPIFWWTCADISFRIVFTYFITRNETSFLSKWHESALIHFVSCKLCSHENLMPVWNLISVKMTDMKSIPFWVSFRLNSCEHK